MTRLAARSVVVGAPGQLAVMGQPKMKETGKGGLTSNVTGLLKQFRWDYVYHPVQTFTAGDRGQPDIFAVRIRDRRILFAELKDASRKLSPRQAEVVAILEQLSFPTVPLPSNLRELVQSLGVVRVETHVWRPEHWFSGEIERVVR